MYYVKALDIATSKLYKKDDENRWYYWYHVEKKFLFMNTVNWGKIDSAETIWSGDDFEEAKRQVIKYSNRLIQKQAKRLDSFRESIYIVYIQQLLLNINNKDLTNAIKSFKEIEDIKRVINNLRRVESSIDRLSKGKK